MSDFYIFLEEKGFTKEQIENLTENELIELTKEFIKEEKFNY